MSRSYLYEQTLLMSAGSRIRNADLVCCDIQLTFPVSKGDLDVLLPMLFQNCTFERCRLEYQAEAHTTPYSYTLKTNEDMPQKSKE